MTPMQMLKNNFLSLSERLKKFEEINLNKSKPKDTWIQNVDDEYALCFPEEKTNFSHFTKKGVKSDFIKIFKAKTKKENYSIGFHFTYLNIAEPKIQCSIKEGETFHMTEEMNIQEFKEKLNHLNDILFSQDLLENISKTKEAFLVSPKPKLKFK